MPLSIQRPKTISNFNKNISFTSINSPFEDVNIRNEVISEPISTLVGNITITDSEIRDEISSTSGNIAGTNSTFKSKISNAAGKIELDNSIAENNIFNAAGDITLYESTINGNIQNLTGKVIIVDSTSTGVIKCPINSLKLRGNGNGGNVLKDVILTEPNAAESVSQFTIKGSTTVINNTVVSSNLAFINSNLINPHIASGNFNNTAESVFKEFKLPKGDKIIGTLTFETKQPGVLVLENGAKFIGKLINGSIRHLH